MDLHAPETASTASHDGLHPTAADTSAPTPHPAPVPASETQELPRPPETVADSGAEPAADRGNEAPAAPATPRKRRRRRRSLRREAPAWAVSLVVHVAILTTLGLATFSTEVKQVVASINSALVPNRGSVEEDTVIWATPGEQRSREAIGSEGSPSGSDGATAAGAFAGGIGSGPPSATPGVAGVGRGIGEKTSLPGVKVVANMSGLGLLPTASKLGVDLGGGMGVGGDFAHPTADVGEALDQIAREILRHLTQHKLTVVWLFDESQSMKDEQKAIKAKFDRVATELKANVDTSKRQSAALNHAIVGFGQALHFELEKPNPDIDLIGRAIDRLKVDDSGVENTMHAVYEVIEHYSGLIKKDRKLLVVLVTDESGDDGGFVEEALQSARSHGVPIYVIGRQSLFGLEYARLKYVDPVTKDVFYPMIRRGPETADLEVLQWDGLHDRRDEHPAGFGPYELARLTRDTGGIYFLLPSEEEMRIRHREQAYSSQFMKELKPDYGSRSEYVARREKSELRRTLHDIITTIKGTSYRTAFPIFPDQLIPAAQEAGLTSNARLNALMEMQKRLESLAKLRDLEPDKRWQAHYDLMLAQVVAYQVKAYEYGALMSELVTKPPKPSQMPTPELIVWWGIHHARDRFAPAEKTAKKYAQAEKLLKQVIERYPNTPWGDIAQSELDRGLSVGRHEAHDTPHPQRAEREKFVPKY